MFQLSMLATFLSACYAYQAGSILSGVSFNESFTQELTQFSDQQFTDEQFTLSHFNPFPIEVVIDITELQYSPAECPLYFILQVLTINMTIAFCLCSCLRCKRDKTETNSVETSESATKEYKVFV